MSKKYVVREGFVVAQEIQNKDGSTYTRTWVAGDEVNFEEADYALHAHKLELADPKDRAAAFKAEQDAAVKRAAASDPAVLIQQLVAALAQSQAKPAAQAAPAA